MRIPEYTVEVSFAVDAEDWSYWIARDGIPVAFRRGFDNESACRAAARDWLLN